MHKRYPSVVSSFPLFSGDKLADAVNSVAFKLGGSQYGPMLAEVLPMLHTLAKAGKVPQASDLYFGERKLADIGQLGCCLYVLIGRSEHSHARGKKLLSGIAGQDGDKTSETIVRERSDKVVLRVKAAFESLKSAPATVPATNKGKKVK